MRKRGALAWSNKGPRNKPSATVSDVYSSGFGYTNEGMYLGLTGSWPLSNFARVLGYVESAWWFGWEKYRLAVIPIWILLEKLGVPCRYELPCILWMIESSTGFILLVIIIGWFPIGYVFLDVFFE